jgi:sarcosine oxidase subunit delta
MKAQAVQLQAPTESAIGVLKVLQIKCPWCGERAEREFHYGGDAKVSRPSISEAAPPQLWLEYIYLRDNPRGAHLEYWQHRSGCRRWFKAMRNTITNDFIVTDDLGPGSVGGDQ